MKELTGPPLERLVFWWLPTPRLILKVQVYSVQPGGGATLRYEHFAGWQEVEPGYVTWTKAEWDAAAKIEYQPPVMEGHFGPDEKLCHSCNGTRWQQERDLEMFPCVWCSYTGRAKKPRESLRPTR